MLKIWVYTNPHSGSVLTSLSTDRNNFNLCGFAWLSERLTLDFESIYFIRKGRAELRLELEMLSKNLPGCVI